MEVLIRPTADHVGLRLFDPTYSTSGELEGFTVELVDPTLRATAPVCAYRAGDLPCLFERMARDWKGWDGPLAWVSLEGEFGLSCTADGLGHVEIAATLRGSSCPTTWSVTALVQVDAGNLDALAADMRRLFNGPGETS